jgi:hypothetical protein
MAADVGVGVDSLGIIVLNESITALMVAVLISVALTRTSDASFLF